MVRLTQLPEKGLEVTVLVEGQVVSEWAVLLERECVRLLDGGRKLHLDLSGVTNADAQGAQVLQRLATRNVTLLHCTPLLLDILGEGRTRRDTP